MSGYTSRDGEGFAGLLRTASAVGVLLAIGSCAVGPRFAKPTVTVPESWRATHDSTVATRTAADSLWWRAFQDPVLDRLVDLAHQQNLPLQVAGLRLVEARAQLGVATGRMFPQLQVAYASATAVGLSENAVNVASVAGIDNHFGEFQLGFDAAWELDIWGKYRRGVEAEKASVLASMADYYYALVSLTAEVARTYVVIRTFEAVSYTHLTLPTILRV